ncbi:conserved hypothetical protein, partial [Ricinus communis]
ISAAWSITPMRRPTSWSFWRARTLSEHRHDGTALACVRQSAGATHSGMFVAWALLSGLGSVLHTVEFVEDLEGLKARSVTPGTFFLEACDGKFKDEDLNEEGNAFARTYFKFEGDAFFRSRRLMLDTGAAFTERVRHLIAGQASCRLNVSRDMHQEHVDRRLKLRRCEALREHHERNQKRGIGLPIDQMKCDLVRHKRPQFARERDAKFVVGGAGRVNRLERLPHRVPVGRQWRRIGIQAQGSAPGGLLPKQPRDVHVNLGGQDTVRHGLHSLGHRLHELTVKCPDLFQELLPRQTEHPLLRRPSGHALEQLLPVVPFDMHEGRVRPHGEVHGGRQMGG